MVFHRKHRFGRRGDNAGAVDAQSLGLAYQAELDRVPVHACQLVEHAPLVGAQAALAVGLDKFGDHGIHQQRHVAEHIVENVGLFQIIQFMRLADELAGRETAVRQVFEEHVVRNQAWHGHHLPAGTLGQHLGQLLEIGDLVGTDGQVLHAANEFVAGAPRQQPALTLVQRLPDCVLLGGVVCPALVDGPVRPVRLIAGCQPVLGGFMGLRLHGSFSLRSCVLPRLGKVVKDEFARQRAATFETRPPCR